MVIYDVLTSLIIFISSMPNSQVNILTQNIFINSNQSQSAQRAVWASLPVSLHIRRAFDSRHEYATDDLTSKRILHHSFIAVQEKHRVVHQAHTSSLDPLCFHLPAWSHIISFHHFVFVVVSSLADTMAQRFSFSRAFFRSAKVSCCSFESWDRFRNLQYLLLSQMEHPAHRSSEVAHGWHVRSSGQSRWHLRECRHACPYCLGQRPEEASRSRGCFGS